MDDEFKVVTEPVDSRVTEIQLFKNDGSANGVARIWPKDGHFRWAHPNGTEGAADSFEKAVDLINSETVHPIERC